MDLIRIAARVAAGLSQPLSDRPDYGSREVVSQREETGVVRKTPGKGYCVKSEKNSDWSGGCYPTQGEANDRLKQVEKFKHMKGSADYPNERLYECPNCERTNPADAERCACGAHLRGPDPDDLDYGAAKSSIPRKKNSSIVVAPSPTGSPFHFNVLRDGVIVGVMSYLADSPEDAVVKMSKMYKKPEGVPSVTVEGPFPGNE